MGASPGNSPRLPRKDYRPAERSEGRESADEVSRRRVWNPDDECGQPFPTLLQGQRAREYTSPNEADVSSHPLWTRFAVAELCSVLFLGAGRPVIRQCDPSANGNLTVSLSRRKNEMARRYFQVHTKQLGFSVDEFHSIFDFKASIWN